MIYATSKPCLRGTLFGPLSSVSRLLHLLPIIKNTEKRVNALLSRVNDRAAFDDEEIGCLFNALVEALPGRRVLEQRAG